MASEVTEGSVCGQGGFYGAGGRGGDRPRPPPGLRAVQRPRRPGLGRSRRVSREKRSLADASAAHVLPAGLEERVACASAGGPRRHVTKFAAVPGGGQPPTRLSGNYVLAETEEGTEGCSDGSNVKVQNSEKFEPN